MLVLIAKAYGRRVDHWLKARETKEYIAALRERSNTPKKGYLKTKRGKGGGTWMHPKLAVAFARWLDADLAVWRVVRDRQRLYIAPKVAKYEICS